MCSVVGEEWPPKRYLQPLSQKAISGTLLSRQAFAKVRLPRGGHPGLRVGPKCSDRGPLKEKLKQI